MNRFMGILVPTATYRFVERNLAGELVEMGKQQVLLGAIEVLLR